MNGNNSQQSEKTTINPSVKNLLWRNRWNENYRNTFPCMHIFFLFYFQAWCRRHIADGYLDQPSVNGPNTMPQECARESQSEAGKMRKRMKSCVLIKARRWGWFLSRVKSIGFECTFIPTTVSQCPAFLEIMFANSDAILVKYGSTYTPRGVVDPAACCIVSFI